MNCNMRTRDFKEMAERKMDDYEEARNYAFLWELTDFINKHTVDISHGKVILENIDEADMQNFIDDFDFPEQWEWAENEVLNDCIDAQEARYDMMKGN